MVQFHGCITSLHQDAKAGKNWLKGNLRVRQKLGLAVDEAPWTSRAGVTLKGLRAQGASPNFQHDLLDLRFAQQMSVWGKELSDALPDDLLTDYTKSLSFHKKNGLMTMQCGSKFYDHGRDRGVLPEEHWSLMGWDVDRLDFSTLTDPWSETNLDRMQPGTKGKRRKTPKRDNAAALRDLIGASICRWDTGALMLCSILAQDGNLFEHPPDPDFVIDLGASASGCSDVVIDPQHSEAFAAKLGNQDDSSDGCEGMSDDME